MSGDDGRWPLWSAACRPQKTRPILINSSPSSVLLRANFTHDLSARVPGVIVGWRAAAEMTGQWGRGLFVFTERKERLSRRFVRP